MILSKTLKAAYQEAARRVPAYEALAGLVGKTIKPPPEEEDLYSPKILKIVGVTLAGNPPGYRLDVNEPLTKRGPANSGPSQTIISRGFFISTDLDSIWMKFLLVEERPAVQATLSRKEVSAVNAMRGGYFLYSLQREACSSIRYPALVPGL